MNGSPAPRRGLGLAAGSLFAVAAVAGGCSPPDAPYDLAWACEPGGVAEIADNFDDNKSSKSWFAFPPGDPKNGAVEQDGQVELRSDGTAKSFSLYKWRGEAASLLGCTASIEVKAIGSTAGEIKTFFSLRKTNADPNVDEIAITQAASSLSMLVYTGGVGKTAGSTTYDAELHRFWRIREDSGTTYFDTSADASQWDNHASAPTPSYAQNVGVVLGVGQNNAAPPSTATFDNLSTVP